MIRYENIWKEMRKGCLWGPSQLPRDDTWMVGPVLRANWPTGHRPTSPSGWNVSGLKWLHGKVLRWRRGYPINFMLYPLGSQTTMWPMQPVPFESSWFMSTFVNTFTQFHLLFCAWRTFPLRWSYCCMMSAFMLARLVKVYFSDKKSSQTLGISFPLRVCFTKFLCSFWYWAKRVPC